RFAFDRHWKPQPSLTPCVAQNANARACFRDVRWQTVRLGIVPRRQAVETDFSAPSTAKAPPGWGGIEVETEQYTATSTRRSRSESPYSHRDDCSNLVLEGS